MDIRILPADIANMIAAGEVVQRPASVVKELMENAVDAGATKVSVIIRDAGRTLVQVIDNGCGMTPDQAVLCFQRHATSKIAAAQDLEAIMTYGFRGEALPSIAAVARVSLKTRTADMEIGTQVTIEGTANQDVRETATPVGSNFAVSDLYYNTPARRKFLKSDAAEMRHITEDFERVALSNPDIAFTLVSADREILRLSPSSTLLFRIRDIFGQGMSDGMLPLSTKTTVVALDGFLARPQSARKTGAEQFFFVNGRYFRSPYMHKAVMKAYENLIPEGTSPSYFIYLTIDPKVIDINVHPTKTEIKFEDDSVLFTVIMAAVKEALGRESFGESLDFDRQGLPQVHNIGSSFEEFRPAADPGFGSNPSFNPFDGDGFPNQDGWDDSSAAAGHYSDRRPDQDYSALFQDNTSVADMVRNDSPSAAEGMSRVIVSGRYALLPSASGFILADMQRAIQRIMYESYIEALTKEEAAPQSTLFPIEVEIGVANMQVMLGNASTMAKLGFGIAPFSPSSILVSAVPSGIRDDKMSVSALIFEMVTALYEEQSSLAASLYGPLAQKLASSAARNAQLPATGALARSLMEQLYNCENPELTPDGHKVVTVLNSDELEKLLK